MNKKSRRKIVNIILLIIIMVAVIALVINIVKMNKTGENTNEQPGNELTQNAVEEKYVETLEDGTRLNTSTKLSEAKTVDGLTIDNIQLSTKNNYTILTANVTNKSGGNFGITTMTITFVDENGNTLATFGGIIGNLANGETTTFTSQGTLDYANAYDFTVTLNK